MRSRFDVGTELLGFGALARGASWSGHERNRMFVNDRGRQFKDLSAVAGLDHIGDGRVFAIFDHDRDGWQDLALLNNNTPAFTLYRNAAGDQLAPSQHRFVALRFVGGNTQPESSSTWSNRDGYGAEVTIRIDGRELVREHRCGEGLSAQNSATMLAGLGGEAAVEHVTVRWPSGTTQKSGQITANQLITVYEDPSQSPTGQAYVVSPYADNARTASTGAQ